MNYSQTTQVPNAVFDLYLQHLGEAELKVLLVIIRQTYGWLDKATGWRKAKDRISSGQFQRKTGYGRRTITSAIKALCDRKLVVVTDYKGNELLYASDRKGKSFLYYSASLPAQNAAPTCASHSASLAQNGAHNKTNHRKRNKAKLTGMRQAVEVIGNGELQEKLRRLRAALTPAR